MVLIHPVFASLWRLSLSRFSLSRSLRFLLVLSLTLLLALSVGMGSVDAAPLFPINHSPNSLFHISGSRPENLGLRNNQLAPCPATPNCVSSFSNDEMHRIEPIALVGSLAEEPEAAIAKLKALITDQERVKLVSDEPDYLYAEFSTRWFGFVDDVEFYLNREAKQIEVRSASRLGESDLGVNRQRIEALRLALAAQ